MQADAEADEKAGRDQRIGDQIVVMAEAAELAGDARQLAVGVIQKMRNREQPRPKHEIVRSQCEPHSSSESGGQSYSRQLGWSHRCMTQRLDQPGGETRI